MMNLPMQTDIHKILSDNITKDIMKEIDNEIIKRIIQTLTDNRKRKIVEKYLKGDATCQEQEEAKNIILDGI